MAVLRNFEIVTDSACDLPLEYFADNQVSLVPLRVSVGQEEYLDLLELSVDDFYVRLATSKDKFQASAPSLDDYEAAFNKFEPGTKLICLCLSSALSSSYESALAAVLKLDASKNIEVLDSRTASAAQGLIVRKLVEARNEGMSAEEALVYARQLIEEIELYFVPGDHPRLSTSKVSLFQKIGSHFKGVSLGLKKSFAIMRINAEGELESCGHCPDLRTASARIARIMSRTAREKGSLRYVEVCAGVPRSLDALEKPLDTNEFLHTRTSVANAGPAVATRVGLGAIGVAFIPEAALARAEKELVVQDVASPAREASEE